MKTYTDRVIMLPIVQVNNKNKLRRAGHVKRRAEESTLRVVMKFKMKENRPRGRPILRWLDNIDSKKHFSSELLRKGVFR